MINHFKALLGSSENQERNLLWHHPRVGHAHLTEKAALLLKSFYCVPQQIHISVVKN